MTKNTETPQMLIETAGKLFAEHGFEAVSTRMIADIAGVNLGGIHYHFGNKEALYVESFRLAAEPTKPLMIEAIIRDEPELMQTPVGQATIITRKITHYYDKYFRIVEPWKTQLILRELCRPSSAHTTLVESVFKPESDDMASFYLMVRPEKSKAEAFYWSHLPCSQSAFYMLTRPFVEKIYGNDFFIKELFKEITRSTSKLMILLLDLPLPENLSTIR